MLDGTYTGLLASIADQLSRTDLAAAIPDFVVITEADLNRKLRTRMTQARVTASVSSQFVTVPADFAGVMSMINSAGTPIEYRDPDAFALVAYQNSSNAGVISDFTITGGSFGFWPAPTTAVSVTITYYQKLPPLATNATNWLLTSHPDAYLYGALTASAPYLQADARLPIWSGLYNNVVNSLKGANKHESTAARLTPQPSPTSIV